MVTAYIGLGSNLEGPEQQLRRAIERLGQLRELRLRAQSTLYISAPLGQPGQPHYCNAVCSVDTELPPPDLMSLLLTVERESGRVRDGRKWAPRVLDLDLLHYEGVELHSPQLTLPHPAIADRNFVLWPLAEIAPELVIPGIGSVLQRAQQVGRAGLELL